MNNQKLILISLFAVLVICACSGFSFAERGLEIDYPNVPGAEAPAEGTELPGYIKYIFNFSVMIGGILAFAVLLFGGIRWMSSVGNPAAISDARSWMLGGIMGLLLLLFTYLILITINPQLAIFGKMKPLMPVTGIYLIDAEEKKKHITTDFSDIKNFDADSMEFIDSPDELTSVFIYKNKNYKATTDEEIMEIKNGEQIPNFNFVPKSLLFFWNKSGVYLYKKIDFCENTSGEYTCLEPPKYLSNSESNLGDWNNKTQSIKFNNKTDFLYGAILFTENEFRGECGVALGELDIENLSVSPPGLSYIHPIGLDKLSSLSLLNLEEETSGDITFYDSIDCKGNKKTFTPTMAEIFENLEFDFFEGTTKPLHKNILSFKITGNFEVLLNTQEGFGDETAKCQLFKKPKTGDCVPTIKGSYVYDPEPEGIKIESMMIIPVSL